MMRVEDYQDTRPWYRQFWPWFLISIPATAVVGGLLVLFIAIKTQDGLVEDDYYKSGLVVNKDLSRDRRATDLGVNARLDMDLTRHRVSVVLEGRGTGTLPALQLSLVHPTRSHHDISAVLSRGPDGRFTGSIAELPSGRWHMQIEPPAMDWRLTGRISVPGEHQVSLRPEAAH